MLEIAGGIILAVVILSLAPFLLVGTGIILKNFFEGICNMFEGGSNIIKVLLAPIAKGFIKLCETLDIPEENWGFVLAVIISLIAVCIYICIYFNRGY